METRRSWVVAKIRRFQVAEEIRRQHVSAKTTRPWAFICLPLQMVIFPSEKPGPICPHRDRRLAAPPKMSRREPSLGRGTVWLTGMLDFASLEDTEEGDVARPAAVKATQ